jgi:dihydroorotate dehydrogenase electron transfer subunit
MTNGGKSMSKQLKDVISAVEEKADGIVKMTVSSPYISSNAKPGQFVNIKCCSGNDALLRRPISICLADNANNTYDIFFQKKGTGTELLAAKKAGDFLDVLGPLGNGFDLNIKYRRIAVVGGGIGIFPLLFVLDRSMAIVKRSYLGFRTSNLIVLENEFLQKSVSYEIATDDGSKGHKGYVTDLLERDISTVNFDMIYACGPEPMLRKIKEISQKYNIPCQASLEQRMGCGFGACLVCACKTLTDDGGWQYSHVCKDGPVFNIRDVVFE